MDIVMMRLADIMPYEKNPRRNDKAVAYVVNSIKEFGFQQPIVIDRDNVIVAGHTRYKAARQMGMKRVPCVIAGDLTEEQVKAYRIADNRTSEFAKWDANLNLELDGIFDIDMLDFGVESKPRADDYKQTKNLDNLFRADFSAGENAWGIPEIAPIEDNLDGIEWISFGEKAKITDPQNMGLHFYIDDYKFESVWKSPDKWIDLFRQCRAVVTPDFSNYTDMPKAQQLWNHYRRQWCGRYWQERGVNVICSLSWANGQIEDWSFCGIPQGTVCATSFVGDGIDKQGSVDELLRVLEIVKPAKLFIKANNTDASELRQYVDFELLPPYKFKG